MPDEIPQSELDVLGGDETADETSETTASEEEGAGTSDDEDTTEEETTEEDESESADEEDESEEATSADDDEKKVLDELAEEELAAEEAQITRPSWKLVKEKYPDLAKDKDFRNIYFRDKAFTEIFTTVAEAKSAQDRAELFDTVDSSLASGNIKDITDKLNEESRALLARNILPALYSTDKKLFGMATQPVIINLLHEIHDYAIESKDENLRKSIRNVCQYLTKSPELPPKPSPVTSPEIEKEKEKLQTERQNIFLRNQRDFLTSADSIIGKKLSQLVEEGLKSNKDLSEFARQAISERTLAEIRRILGQDESLGRKMETLYKLAAKSGFTNEHKARIISASLERARTIIPGIRAKHIASALGRQPSKSNGKDNKIVAKAGDVTSGKTSSKGVISVKDIDTKKTSELDFLDGKVHLRK